MSVQAISWAMAFEAESATEKAVLFVLANFADGNGACYPGQQNVAKLAACSERSVRRVMDSLEDRRVIVREERRREDGSRTSDSITLIAFQQAANLAGCKETNRPSCPKSPDTVAGIYKADTKEDTKAAAAREKSDFDALSEKLVDAVGEGNIQGHGALVIGPIIGLIEAGCDLHTDILPTIRAVSSRLKRPAGSWTYFVPAIREAYEARIEAGRCVVKPPTPAASEKRWNTRLKAARQRGQWSSTEWGPAPGQPGSIVPEHLLQPGDGEGWREWQSEAA